MFDLGNCGWCVREEPNKRSRRTGTESKRGSSSLGTVRSCLCRFALNFQSDAPCHLYLRYLRVKRVRHARFGTCPKNSCQHSHHFLANTQRLNFQNSSSYLTAYKIVQNALVLNTRQFRQWVFNQSCSVRSELICSASTAVGSSCRQRLC